MSWESIDKASLNQEAVNKATKEKRAESAELAKAYHRCFDSEEGKKVFADLHKRFIHDNDTSFGSPNPNYEAAYHNGESGVVKFILNQITQAKIL
jgi:hypothetical protein|tara:strand:- start:29 stop:313 length:285 start_codon:yes stop_codon:yes gene_type:complete